MSLDKSYQFKVTWFGVEEETTTSNSFIVCNFYSFICFLRYKYFILSVLEKISSCCLIETRQSSEYYWNTFLSHENFKSSVKANGISHGIRWNVCKEIQPKFAIPQMWPSVCKFCNLETQCFSSHCNESHYAQTITLQHMENNNEPSYCSNKCQLIMLLPSELIRRSDFSMINI